MNFPLVRRMAARLSLWSCVSVFALGLSSCGGGGGDDDETGPAPLTMNALVLTLYTSGVELTFVRAEGDASTGVETGAVTMKINPAGTTTVDSSGAPTPLQPSNSISGGRYTYVRSGPESGTITVSGQGSGQFGASGGILIGPITVPSNYFRQGTFTRNYSILFGTDGASITGIDVNDWGEGSTFPGILWNNATLRVFGGALVTNAWSLENSKTVSLPKLYPTSVSGQLLYITPTNVAENALEYKFLSSTFTRFSDAKGDFIEEGVGNSQIVGQTALTIVNFDYQPDPATTNKAVIRIYNASGPTIIYNMTFLDQEKGTYIQDNGSVGTFDFPFLDQSL
jgi:hypothetical protein